MLVRPQTHNNTYGIIWKTNIFNGTFASRSSKRTGTINLLNSWILAFLHFAFLDVQQVHLMYHWTVVGRLSAVWCLSFRRCGCTPNHLTPHSHVCNCISCIKPAALFLSTPGEWHFGHKVLKNPILDLKFQPVQWKERFLIVTPLRCSTLNGF